jgi:hypothetical protein
MHKKSSAFGVRRCSSFFFRGGIAQKVAQKVITGKKTSALSAKRIFQTSEPVSTIAKRDSVLRQSSCPSQNCGKPQ